MKNHTRTPLPALRADVEKQIDALICEEIALSIQSAPREVLQDVLSFIKTRRPGLPAALEAHEADHISPSDWAYLYDRMTAQERLYLVSDALSLIENRTPAGDLGDFTDVSRNTPSSQDMIPPTQLEKSCRC
jgi:hypothetical protein